VGACFRAVIALRLERPAAHLEVVLRFDNLLGHRVLATSSAFDPRFPGSAAAGDHEVVCEIPGLTLMPGEYRLRLALVLDGVEVDAIDDASRLTVLPSDYYGTGRMPRSGAFVLRQGWSLR
jgi:lipopolysaccharide transport system ATP-binding protein